MLLAYATLCNTASQFAMCISRVAMVVDRPIHRVGYLVDPQLSRPELGKRLPSGGPDTQKKMHCQAGRCPVEGRQGVCGSGEIVEIIGFFGPVFFYLSGSCGGELSIPGADLTTFQAFPCVIEGLRMGKSLGHRGHRLRLAESPLCKVFTLSKKYAPSIIAMHFIPEKRSNAD